MSDIASLGRLKPSSAQLPVSWYLDPEIFALEKKLLFDAGPNYVGHELMVPNAGDYRSLEWMDHAKVLVRNNSGVELLSNVCRHRQAIMLEGSGNTENIVCPLHRWTYDMKGGLLGAPHFPENPCVRLHSTPLTNWKGMLFAGPRNPVKDLEKLSLAKDFDFSGYVLDRVRIDDYAINWKTFVSKGSFTRRLFGRAGDASTRKPQRSCGKLPEPLPVGEATNTTLCFRFSEMRSAPPWHVVRLPCCFPACLSKNSGSAPSRAHDVTDGSRWTPFPPSARPPSL